MRKVIVNSTPIISLAKTNSLYILKEMYGQVMIPEAVFNEVTKKDDAAKALQSASIHRYLKGPVDIYFKKISGAVKNATTGKVKPAATKLDCKDIIDIMYQSGFDWS